MRLESVKSPGAGAAELVESSSGELSDGEAGLGVRTRLFIAIMRILLSGAGEPDLEAIMFPWTDCTTSHYFTVHRVSHSW